MTIITKQKKNIQRSMNTNLSKFSEKNASSDTDLENLKIGNFQEAFGALKNSEFYESVSDGDTSKGISKLITRSTVLVNSRQRGNPLLQYIKNVPWEYADIVPDYVMGSTTCALYLSIRYHNLNPDYIHERLKLLKQQYRIRVLLVQVDVKDPFRSILHLTRISILANLILILAFSIEEAGKIIETYKIFENKTPDMIREKQESGTSKNHYMSKIIDSLCAVRSINRTDALTLLSTFGSLKNIINASEDELALCPGIGKLKASKLQNVFKQSFNNTL